MLERLSTANTNAMTARTYQTCAAFFLWITVAASAIGQTHEGHSSEQSHGRESKDIPTETGQSAFAAIAEIIALLENDPHTDWSEVNIDALRNHLTDMNQLTMSASVTTQQLSGEAIQFQVVGQGRTLQAIQTMVPAHARMVRTTNDWDIEVVDETDGVTLIVTPGTPEGYTKLNALGFFGFMTIGAHHQLHHIQIAKGKGH